MFLWFFLLPNRLLPQHHRHIPPPLTTSVELVHSLFRLYYSNISYFFLDPVITTNNFETSLVGTLVSQKNTVYHLSLRRSYCVYTIFSQSVVGSRLPPVFTSSTIFHRLESNSYSPSVQLRDVTSLDCAYNKRKQNQLELKGLYHCLYVFSCRTDLSFSQIRSRVRHQEFRTRSPETPVTSVLIKILLWLHSKRKK